MTFGARLHSAIAERGPFCVGIDPHAALLEEWGLGDDVGSLEFFALRVVEAVAPHVSVVKPQSAFYERFGSRGIAVLERVIAESRAAGALVLLDVKRGDIGSTSQAYADAYLDPTSPLASDAITVSPYLGFGSLDPFIDTARRHDAGVFVLALTSNKEGPEVQHAYSVDGGTVAGTMLDHLRHLNADAAPLGSFGAVVGATIGSTDEDLAFNGPVLAPGFGAQGGTIADVRRLFGSAAAVLPSSSREVLRLGPGPDPMREFVLRTNHEAPFMRLALALLMVALLVTGCKDQQEKYCDAVKDHQQELGEVLGDGSPDALLKALPIFRDLADEAPEDLRDEWKTVIDAVAGLQEALKDAGVDPATYDRDDPPEGLSQADQQAIDAAARRLDSEETVTAFSGVDQQAKDVCGTSLQI